MGGIRARARLSVAHADRDPVLLGYDEFQRQRYFPVLDAIRAGAVVAVVAWHVGSSDFLRWFQGGRGVTWFFALSGFLITTLSLREESRNGTMAVRPFYIRRAFRILPLYVIALATYFVADVFIFRNSAKTEAWSEYWPYYFVFLQDIPVLLWEGAPFQVAWSLAVEERFYLAWPAIGFVVLTRQTRLVATGCLSLALAAAVVLFDGRVVNALVRPVLPIMLGCFAAVLLHRRDVYDGYRRVASIPLLLCGTLLLLVPWSNDVRTNRFFFVAYCVVLAAVVGAAAMASTKRVRVPDWVLWIGLRSYAIYLFHTQAIRVVEKAILRSPLDGVLAGVIAFAVALGISCVVADLLHRTIESPLILRGRKVAGRSAALT